MSRYLNHNSTYIGDKKLKFNPSDIYYSDNVSLKTQEMMVKNFIKEYLNASDNAKVIFNSGASESIANCMVWAKSISKFGTILGSVLDHPSVKENAENMELNYKSLSYEDLEKKEIEIPDNVIMTFITGVCPKTGEIYPLNKLKKYNYLSEGGDLKYSKNARQIRDLRVLDASQMIGKIKIDMIENNLNAVFFSCHKIGGEFNTGVLVINEQSNYYKFKPLISGTQQDHLRGGTYNTYAYMILPNLLKSYSEEFNEKECKTIYNKFTKTLDAKQINYYKPVLPHLYNTILIHLNGCNAETIHTLSEYGIYTGSSTACQSDNVSKELRISYLNASEFGSNTINKICDIVEQENYKDNEFDKIDEENNNDEKDKSENKDDETQTDLSNFKHSSNDEIIYNSSNSDLSSDSEDWEKEEKKKINKLNEELDFEDKYI